jgi:hypothetical protein
LDEGEYDDVWPTRLPSSARRYQGLADVQVPSGRRGDVNSSSARHTIPPRRTATQKRVSINEGNTQTTDTQRFQRGRAKSQRRFHWLAFVGIALLVMIFGWIALNALGTWWQTTLNDWQYGRPRTFQIDAVVGHHDSPQNPSHFIAMNLNGHIIVIEIPGDDVSKSVVFSGPTLLGSGQDLAPVTLTFQDVNHDGKLDMIVNVQGHQFIFLNEHGTFVPSTQSQNSVG